MKGWWIIVCWHWTLEYMQEIISIFLIYSLFHTLLLTIFFEVLWPTHFFNRRHVNNFFDWHFRTFVEVIGKLLKINLVSNFFKKIWSYYFLKNFSFLLNLSIKKRIFHEIKEMEFNNLNFENILDDEDEIFEI